MAERRRPAKPTLPEWLVEFINTVSERFEPFSGVARVGFECQKSENGWEIALFLGEHEVVGGADDGHVKPVNFRFDLNQLSNCFDHVTQVFWNVFPNSHVCQEVVSDLSFVTIEGHVQTQQVRLQLHAGPPDTAGPALRQYPDGRLELV